MPASETRPQPRAAQRLQSPRHRHVSATWTLCLITRPLTLNLSLKSQAFATHHHSPQPPPSRSRPSSLVGLLPGLTFALLFIVPVLAQLVVSFATLAATLLSHSASAPFRTTPSLHPLFRPTHHHARSRQPSRSRPARFARLAHRRDPRARP